MATIKRVLLHTLVLLILTACFFNDPNNAPQSGTAILQFQSQNEELKLASLRVAKSVYPDVTLTLSRDGSWHWKSIGAMRPLDSGESVQAILTTPAAAALDLNWLPDDATITIRRIHVDDKVFGDLPLRLIGRNWFWGNALQAGKDAQDSYELKALTVADYRANPALAASEAHHTVLQSAPGSGAQSFPIRLDAKAYRFCMDPQDGGADQIRLLDPAGAAVFNLRAGDACVDVDLGSGLYTMQHTYGGAGARRTVFIRPAATPRQASALPAAANAQDLLYPEYWALYLPATAQHPDGLLSFNRTYVVKQIYGEYYWVDNPACLGAFDAAAQLDFYTRPGEGGEVPRRYSLFNSKNFFSIGRDGSGAPSTLSYPLACPTASNNVNEGRNFYLAQSTAGDAANYAIPLAITPNFHVFTYPPFISEPLRIVALPDDRVRLVYTKGTADIDLGFDHGTVMTPISADGFNQVVADPQKSAGAFGPTQSPESGVFQVWFRYFPNGLPPSMKDADGNWILAQGEVALFPATDCKGAAMLAKHSGVLNIQRTQANGAIADFNGSLQVGPNTVATFTQVNNYQNKLPVGTKKVLNQSGCLNQQIDLSQQSLTIAVTTQINIQTNSCEYCNLAGIDLGGLDLTGVKLQHANLTGATLSNANLTRSDLRSATLQGAFLNQANLEQANLCQAFLNGKAMANGTSGSAAQLSGAHLKDANLSSANLDGANFSNASFYSSALPPCQPTNCDSYQLPACASAYGASMNNTKFINAYLAGVDMGATTANAAIFTRAILFGASLGGATMNRNPSTGDAADFTYAFLQGTNFTNAKVDYANFTNAYVDSDGGTNCMQVLLQSEFTAFPGFASGSAGSCVPGMQSAPTCIQYTYGASALPATGNSNSCPDSTGGPCSGAKWIPKIPLAQSSQKNSACTAIGGLAPLCNGFTQPLNTCW